VVNVPDTCGWQNYTTVDGGTFQFAPATHHTVRLEFPHGGLNADYWTATTTAPAADQPSPSTTARPRPATISLQASNGKFVTAESAGAQPLIANRDAARGWETFHLIANADGTFSLRSAANGRFVTSGDGTSPLIAGRSASDGSEHFTSAGPERTRPRPGTVADVTPGRASGIEGTGAAGRCSTGLLSC
jgi:hypothetical protein